MEGDGHGGLVAGTDASHNHTLVTVSRAPTLEGAPADGHAVVAPRDLATIDDEGRPSGYKQRAQSRHPGRSQRKQINAPEVDG